MTDGDVTSEPNYDGRGFAERLQRFLPGLTLLGSYRRSWLLHDALAGLVLTAILVPTGMGYAQAAGLPVVYGLYATIVPLLAYALFGPSRVLVLGPDSSLAALIAATVLPLAAGSPERAGELAALSAMLCGLLCVVAGLARLGFVTDLLSKPIRYGYINGIVLTVLVGQLPKLLGFTVAGDGILDRVRETANGAAEGRINAAAVAIGVGSLAVILGCKRWAPKVPGILLAAVGSTLVVHLFRLSERTDLTVVGVLPQGLPRFELPRATLQELQELLVGAVAVVWVSFADMSVLSRIYAQRGGYRTSANQEIIALGVANLATGFFQGFPVGASASRTPVAEAAGAKSQLAGVVGAAGIAAMLLFAPAVLRSLPHAALAAVVVCACLGQLEVRGVVRLYRLRPSELVFSLACLFGVLFLGAVQGIFIAVGLALSEFIWRAWRPYDAVLGRVDGLKGYHDVSRHPEAKRIPGLVLFRWDAPLFFANAAIFQEHVLRAVRQAPTPTKWVVVAAEPVTDIDLTAADMLVELDRQLHAANMDLVFAEMKGPVKDRLKRYGLFTTFGGENFFPTLGQAVDRYVDLHQVDWTDWEERTDAGPATE
ncbi:MAG: SulP family inorganic anion transporter [Planctomycetaceae bacterium]|nr:SulP family inorganic anion transporter [Planctomycetaceae bacterium]